MANGEGVLGWIPSLPIAIVGLVAYLAVSIALWFRWIRGSKPRKYMLPVAIGSLTMAVGFGIRAHWKYKPDSVTIYAVQTLFLLLSPCAYLAQCYILLPRLAHNLDSADLLFISATKIGKIFIWTDVVTFLLQGAGGGMSSGGSVAMSDAGHWITIVGLAIQCASFGTFTILFLVFLYRLKTRKSFLWTSTFEHPTRGITRLRKLEDWRSLVVVLLLNCVAIILRSVFRLAEYVDGYDSYLATHEGYFYLLDALPLLLGIALFIVVWPPTLFEGMRELGLDQSGDGMHKRESGRDLLHGHASSGSVWAHEMK